MLPLSLKFSTYMAGALPSLKSSTYMAGTLPILKSSTYMAGTLPKIVFYLRIVYDISIKISTLFM